MQDLPAGFPIRFPKMEREDGFGKALRPAAPREPGLPAGRLSAIMNGDSIGGCRGPAYRHASGTQKGGGQLENAQPKVWFITGAGSGIGKAVVNAALENGDRVIATTRAAGKADLPDGCEGRALVLPLDVSDTSEAVYENAVRKGCGRFGRIDVLVNSAGFGGVTNFEETSEETIRRMFEVNLFGLMRVTRAVLPVMRRQRSGRIFNIASAAGYSAGPVPYHTSKFAVTGFSASLAFEVAPFGIHVTNVAPGLFRTDFYARDKWGTEPDYHIPDYDGCRWQTDFVAEAQKHEQPGNPDKLARLLLEVAAAENPPLHLAIGEDAPAVMDAYGDRLKQDTDAWREKAVRTGF